MVYIKTLSEAHKRMCLAAYPHGIKSTALDSMNNSLKHIVYALFIDAFHLEGLLLTRIRRRLAACPASYTPSQGLENLRRSIITGGEHKQVETRSSAAHLSWPARPSSLHCVRFSRSRLNPKARRCENRLNASLLYHLKTSGNMQYKGNRRRKCWFRSNRNNEVTSMSLLGGHVFLRRIVRNSGLNVPE